MSNIKSIETHEKKEKKKQRNRIVIGIILIVVMISSTISFAFFNNADSSINEGNKITYKEIEFIQDQNGLWQWNFNGNQYITTYNPQETEDISINLSVSLADLYNKPLYFVSERNEPVAELAQNIGIFVERYQKACLQGLKCEEDLVEKN